MYGLSSRKRAKPLEGFRTTLQLGSAAGVCWLDWGMACGERLPDGKELGMNPVKKGFLMGQDPKTPAGPERHGLR